MSINDYTVKVVLFDLGNVLVDLGGVEDIQKILNVQGDESDVWLKWLRSPSVAAFDSGKLSFDDFAKKFVREVGLKVDKKEFKEAFMSWPKGLFAGALELVASVKPEYRRAILSNTNSAHWPRLMEEMGLAGCFHNYFASHLIGYVKPDPVIYDYVIEALQVKPENILFIDDNQINVDTALEKGMIAHQAKGVVQAKGVLEEYGVLL